MLLFIDTVTTGPWLFNQPIDHPDQPHLLAIAAQLRHPNNSFVRELNSIITPNGWYIPAEAAKLHHITPERAALFGDRLPVAMAKLADMLSEAAAGKLIAHNTYLALNVLQKAFKDAALPTPPELASIRTFCIMQAIGERPHYRQPTLSQAWEYMFDGIPLREDRNAMEDILNCRDIYFAGQDRGWWQ